MKLEGMKQVAVDSKTADDDDDSGLTAAGDGDASPLLINTLSL